MTDLPGADAAAARIRRRFGRAVRFTGAGLANQSVLAVRSHGQSGGGFERPVRELWFELGKDEVALSPANGDSLVENDGTGAAHRVIEVIDRDDVDAWMVRVELA